ncbi:energy transducer TonB [Myxococcaceae bacterium GXIMD 01537]
MASVSSWKNAALLLLALALPPGCATSLSQAEAMSAPDILDAEQDIRPKAELLCQHDVLAGLVTSRLPRSTPLGDYFRGEDLAFLMTHPERASLTPFDRPGLHEELARFVSCEVTSVKHNEYFAYVQLSRTTPRWEGPRFHVEDLLQVGSREEARALLADWEQRGPERVTTEHLMMFVNTDAGWRASYWLPERHERPVGPMGAQVARTLGIREMAGPRRISGPNPEYTAEALAHRAQGIIAVRCILTREGAMKNCRILKSVPYMDEPVLKALHATRYAPVTLDGEPLEIEYFFTVRLKLPQ